MRITFLFPALLLFLWCCSPENETGNDLSGKRRSFKTGCYQLDRDSAGAGLYSQSDGRYYYLDTLAVIDIDDFKEVSVSKSTGKYLVNLVLTNSGARKFTKATEDHLGEILAFVVDDKLVMTPQINQKITGNSILIDGSFTEEEMMNCYRQIKSSLNN